MFWLRLTGELDVAALGRAYRDLLARHRVLRVVFEEAGDGLVQRPVEQRGSDLVSVVERVSPDAVDAAMHDLAAAPFDPATSAPVRARLLRVGPSVHVLVVALHHLVADRTSVRFLVADLAALYAARRRGEPAPPPSGAEDYLDFALGEAASTARIASGAASYWRRALAAGVDRIILPTHLDRDASDTSLGHFETVLEADVRTALSTLARRHRVTMYAVLMAGLRAMLARYGNPGPVAIFSPVNLRPDRTATVGPYINLVPLVASVDTDRTFAELLAELRVELRSVLRYSAMPVETISEFGGVGPLERQVALDYLTRPSGPVTFDDLEVEVGSSGAQSAEIDLRIEVEDDFTTLTLGCHYAAAAFDTRAARRMIEHLVTLLTAAADDEHRRIRDLPLAASGEGLSVAKVAPEPGPSFLDRFSAAVRGHPDRLAVVCGGNELTYRELSDRADRVAGAIRERGCGPEAVVGVDLDRSVDLVVAFLGVLRAGAVYLPLDAAHPADRLRDMVTDSGTVLVLTDAEPGCAWPVPTFAMRDLPTAVGETAAPADTDAAYMIYTSGSTGRPKPALLEHRNVAHLVDMQRRCSARHCPAGWRSCPPRGSTRRCGSSCWPSRTAERWSCPALI